MQFKTNYFSLVVIAWTLANQSSAQITVTQNQFQAIFSAGKTIRFYTDTTSKTVNVGRIGGPNIYDLHNLPFFFAERETVFSVSQIPKLAARYSLTSLAIKKSDGSGGFEYPVFSFSNQNWLYEGKAQIFSPTSERYRY